MVVAVETVAAVPVRRAPGYESPGVEIRAARGRPWCGASSLLSGEYLPLMDKFDDLDWLEAEFRRTEWRWPGYVANWGEGAPAMVIADRRDSPEIDELAAAITLQAPHYELGPWLATRMLRGDMTGRPEAGLPEPKKGTRR